MAGASLLRLALAGTALWAGGAAAQDAPQLEPGGAAILGPISVTATSNPIAAFDYPGMVTVIDRAAIDNAQPSTPDDILRYVPNVAFTGGPRRTGEAPSIRGFSGPDVVVLLDGARQNFGSAHDGRFFVDPSLLTSVEVLRGPASSLYGSGGTGGVIELRTLRASDLLAPGETAGIRFGGGFQSANEEWAGNVTAFARPIEGLDVLGSFTLRDSGDIHLGDGSTLTDSDDRIRSGLAKAGYEFGGGHRAEASYLRFRNDAEEPNNPQGAGSEGEVDKDIESDIWRLSYGFASPTDPLIDLNATAYYAGTAVDELRLDNLGAGPAGELLTRRVETLGLRIDNRSRFTLREDAGLTLTYGIEAYNDEQDGEAGGRPRDGVPAAEATFYGLFTQGEFTFDRPLGAPGRAIVIPGLRYDHYRLDSDLASGPTKQGELSPRLGLSYLPADWLLLFGNYAHAFRAPTFDELYLTGQHFRIPIGPGIVNRFVPNPDLKPQRTDTIEVGAGLQFFDLVAPGDGFRVKGTWFWIDGKDFIDLAVNQPTPFVDCNPFIPGNCDGTTTNTNVPRAELEGAEIEASYEIDRFRLGLGYGHLDGENADTGAPLGVLTPDQYIVDAAIRVPEIDGLFGWRSIFAERFTNTDDPAEERDAYDVHGIYFVWEPTDGYLRGLRVDLGIDNLFDEKYARVFTDAFEPGRNYKIAARYTLTW